MEALGALGLAFACLGCTPASAPPPAAEVKAKPAMPDVKDFALSKSDLDVINPGPGEYVHVLRATPQRVYRAFIDPDAMTK